jgi:flagellar biosynthetic protein FliQ
MTPEFITGFLFDSIKIAIGLAAPMLLAGLVVGLLVSIFQAATSINEMTLTFIPKMLAVAVALIFFFPWMMQTMIVFTQDLFDNLIIYVR